MTSDARNRQILRIILTIVGALIVLDLAALKWGVDSRDLLRHHGGTESGWLASRPASKEPYR